MASDAATIGGASPVLPRPAIASGAWWVVAVLTLLFMLSFTDRNMIRALVDPIRADLHVGDVQVSLLVGIAFSILYSIACIPFGYAADRVSRRVLLALGVLCWSAMSMLCGVAGTFAMLFVGRMGLGIGEAVLQPCAMSLIRDSFPPDRRARPLAIYATGPLVGSALAFLVGGWLFGLADGGATRGLPLLGALRPWQFALVMPGAVGLIFALLALTMREPRRVAVAAAGATGMGDTFRHIRANARLYTLAVAMPTLWSLGNTGWMAWLIASIGRQWHLSPGVVGPTAGLISLGCASVGSIGLGFYIDHRAARGDPEALLRLSAIVQCLHAIPAVAMFFMPTLTMVWVCFGFASLLIGSTQVAAYAVVTQITPGRLVGKTFALFNIVQNFLGLAIGPTVFALVAAAFFTGPRAIVWATVVCYPLTLGGSALLAVALMRARRHLAVRDIIAP